MHNKYQQLIDETFVNAFGRTPLTQRLDDIMGETLELQRFTDMTNLKEETGDLLCSVIQLASECDWNMEELINCTIAKINRRQQQYKALGRKRKCALLGGAFDPVHDGHIKLAQFVLNTSKTFDEVWLVPANRHMYGKEMAPAAARVEMCELAVEVDRRIKVFPYEIQKDLSGETYHFATRLLEEQYAKDEYDFSMIIGQDNANTFADWVNYEHLEKMMRFIVVSRQGEEPNNADWYLKPPHIYLKAETAIPEISSTLCRMEIGNIEYLQDQCGCDLESVKHMNPKVIEYIKERGLYKE